MNNMADKSAFAVGIADFDISIPDIQLIHQNDYRPKMSYTAYNSGRMTYGLVYTESGMAHFKCEKENIYASEGIIMFMPFNSKYSVEAISNENFLHYTVNFNIDLNKEQNGILYDYFIGDRILYMTTKNKSMFLKSFQRLLNIWTSKNNGYRLAARSELYNLIFEFFKEYENQKVDRSDLLRISPAKKYIDENFHKHITIGELSSICGLSETHMRRLFREIYRISPIEYQINLRIMRAKDLLLSKMYTVNEVSEICGFADAGYFGRLFKSNVGLSPLKYKNTH